MSGICTTVCSIFLTLFSIVLFFLGLAIITFPVILVALPAVLGAYSKVDVDIIVCIILIVAGGLLILSSILGCVIACKRPFVLILVFISIVLISMCMQVGAILYMKDSVNKVFTWNDFNPEVDYKDYMDDYWSTNSTKIDERQQKSQCCGYESYLDWNSVNKNAERMKAENAVDGYVPRSCCINEERCSTLPDDVYSQGCKDVAGVRPGFVEMFQPIFSSGPPSSLCFQLFGVILAIILAVLVRKGKGDDRGQFIPMSNQTSL